MLHVPDWSASYACQAPDCLAFARRSAFAERAPLTSEPLQTSSTEPSSQSCWLSSCLWQIGRQTRHKPIRISPRDLTSRPVMSAPSDVERVSPMPRNVVGALVPTCQPPPALLFHSLSLIVVSLISSRRAAPLPAAQLFSSPPLLIASYSASTACIRLRSPIGSVTTRPGRIPFTISSAYFFAAGSFIGLDALLR